MRRNVDTKRVDALSEVVHQEFEKGGIEPPIEITGGLPEMLEAFAMRPDIVDPLFEFQRIVYFEGQIDRGLVEKIYVSVSRLNGCQFCAAAHTEALDRFDLDEAPLNEREAAAIDYAEQVTMNANQVSDDLFARVQNEFTVGEIVELTFTIGFINLLNQFNDALNVRYEES